MGQRLGTSKDMQKLVRAAEKSGWKVSITGGNHIKFMPPNPDQKIIFGALTGTPTGNKKLRAMLIKEGLRV